MSACDPNSGSALHKRLRPLIPKPPSNKLIDSQSHYTLTAEVANEACIVGRRDLKKDDLQMARATYFKTSTEILQTQTSHFLRLNPRREAGICRGSSVSSRWNPTTDQLKILEDLYKKGIRTPSAEQIQCITAQLRHYGKIEGKNVFYWFQNHKARERQKRRRRIEMLQLETAPANDSDAAKPSEGIPKRPHACSPHTLSNANTAVVAGPAASNRMNSSSPLYTNILAKEPESLKSFLKLAMPSAWENREEEHRGTTLANCRCPKSVNNRKNISEFTAPVHPIFFTTLKHFQQQNSASIERLRAKADHAGSSGLINDGAQCSKGANRDDGWEFIGPDHIATAECNALRIDDVETLELFPLHSCFSAAEALGPSKPAGSESSVLSCQVEPKSSSSLSGASCTDEKRNSTSSQDNGGFDFGKYDEGVNCSKTYEEEQLTYVKLDEREKPQQKPCQFFHFLPLRM